VIGGGAAVDEEAKRAMDADEFAEVLRKADAIGGHREAIELFFEALALATGRDADGRETFRAVEKAPLQEENVGELRAWFPDAQFVHLVRNPYAVAVSERKRSAVGFPTVHLMRWYQTSLEYAMENAHLGDDVYRILRFEDLVS